MQESDESEDEGSNAWAWMIQLSYDKHDKLYREKVHEFMDGDVGEKQASQRAFHVLIPKYRRSFMENYKTFVKQMYALDRNSQHREIMHVLDWYMQWKGYNFEKALDITMKKKRQLFQDILEEEDDEEEEEEEAGDIQKEDTEEGADADDEDEDDIPLSKLAKRQKI